MCSSDLLPLRHHTADLFDAARSYLNTYQQDRGPHPVLLLDDAEGLSVEAFDVLRRLTAYDLDADDRFSLLISGTDDILRTLQDHNLEPLRSRISYPQPLRPFSLEDTRNYIRFHLHRAGVDKNLITDNAAARMFHATLGKPRSINQLSLYCLIQAAIAGIDAALHDWLGQKENIPVWKKLGVDLDKMPPTSYTIGIDEPDMIAKKVAEAGDYSILKVKVGTDDDERILEAVKRTGMKYMMAETSYYRAPIITCREWSAAGKFGTIFQSEAEYHHEGLLPLFFDDRGLPTWRHGLPPMLYPTHCTGMVVPVTGERLSEVRAIGWGDGHKVLRTNRYNNPFWSTNAFFKTSGGHSSRISICWHIAAGGTERATFYGDRLSYIMARPEGSPDTVVRIAKNGETVIDANGYPEGKVTSQRRDEPDYFERLPEPMRVKTGHGNSHTFLTHEFIGAIVEDRQPAVNIWEAIAYTLPGIVAHRSALAGGESLRIKDYGKATA